MKKKPVMKSSVKNGKKAKCHVCGKQFHAHNLIQGGMVRESVSELILRDKPQWSHNSFICINDLDKYRADYVEDILELEKGELSQLEKDVVKSLKRQDVLTRDINKEFEHTLTFGERLSDKIAEFGGSWPFLIFFGCFLFMWVGINSILLMVRPFDPYPFILLNLILSCLAAIQAPVIMMSQNRQAAKDRLRSEQDYRVNLKSELMIRQLHHKLDQLLSNQWNRLLEIQRIQIDLMTRLTKKKK